MPPIYTSETVQITWDTDPLGIRRFVVYSIVPNTGQYRLESTFDQGPFDTTLEVAQWCWRVIARLLPPSS